MRRRTGLDPADLAADLGPETAAQDADVLTSSLCFVDGPPTDYKRPPLSAADDGSVRATTVTWREGVLEVVAEVAGPTEALRASIYSHKIGVEWPLPEPTVDGSRITLRIDPEHVPGAGRLSDGLWWPSVRTGEGPETATLLEVSPQVAHGATFRRLTAVSFAARRRLGLDVGGRLNQPIRWLDPQAATVVEDSRGSLLTSPVPNLDLPPGARIDGELRLGELPVVAWLVHQDGSGPVLQAWVSGLAGESPLHTRFTPGRFGPTGTQLVIDGVGTMTVTPVPAKEPAKTPPEALVEPASGTHRLVRRVARSVRR
jgi:hypothetical protein